MYTVLLVDDEPTMLETLKNSVYWQQFGVETLLTAPDGVQAMKLLAQQTVHLVITDIKMPYMDGIALLKSVRSLYPDTHIILLSAYTEFEYARQAVGLGADNYLLKPLRKGELEENIERALDNIYSNRNSSQQLFRNNIFMRWVSGTISDNELADRATMLNINLYLPQYQVLILHKKQKNLSLSSYCQACVKQLENDYDTHHFKDDLDQHVFIIGGNLLMEQTIVSCFIDNATCMGISSLITLSIGSIVSGTDSIPESFQVARSLLENSSPQEDSTSGIAVLRQKQEIDPLKDLIAQHLNILFHEQDSESLHSRCQTFTDGLITNVPQKNITHILTQLTYSLRHLFSLEFPKYPEVQKQVNNRICLCKQVFDSESLRSEIVELLEYSHLLYRYYTDLLSPIVQSAIRYIHEHYPENISIQDFCNVKKVSAPYLGYLFKNETGVFFNSYLTQYRISSSIPLLLDLELKINDIATRVGFSSTNYYITRFRQQTGLSPVKYRARITK